MDRRECLYTVLGVDSTSQTDIRAVYLKHARSLHPDKNKGPDANGKFQVLNKAYLTLSHPNSSSAYDAFQSDPNQQNVQLQLVPCQQDGECEVVTNTVSLTITVKSPSFFKQWGPMCKELYQNLNTDYTLVICQLLMMACLKNTNTNRLWGHDLPFIE